MPAPPSETGAMAPADMRRALRRITTLHTLGPADTNCEQAAATWWRRQGRRGAVVLHPTLEEAADHVDHPSAGLLACVVYPELHTLVFERLHELVLVDCFVVPTHSMVLASRPDVGVARSVALHPAPAALVPEAIRHRVFVTSNSEAARQCAAGLTDACIATLPAARDQGLRVVRDFGPVAMGFTVHARRDDAA